MQQEKKEQEGMCKIHLTKQVEFICFDKKCRKNNENCMLCIKNDHVNCKNEFLVPINEIRWRVEVQKNEVDEKEMTKKMNELMELGLFEMAKTIEEKRDALIKSIDNKDIISDVLNPAILLAIKKNYKIEFDPETDKLVLTPKLNLDKRMLENCLEAYERALEKEMAVFVKQYMDLTFELKGSISAQDFISHKNIKIENSGGAVLFTRHSTDSAFNYFTAIYSKPLTSFSRFKLTVKSIYQNDRFLDFGIITESKMTKTKTNFINSFGSGGISYCGYSYTGGLVGKSLTNSSNDGSGFGPGGEITMEYEPGKSIRFHNDKGSLDMKKTMSHSNENYYLFIVLYHPTSSCTLEQLN